MSNIPVGKLEYSDGQNWFDLATEDFVKGNQYFLESCALATTEPLNAVYDNGLGDDGIGSFLESANVGQLALDGILISSGRVLVKDQMNHVENGIYDVVDAGSITSKWKLVRSDDMNLYSKLKSGAFVSIFTGNTQSQTIWTYSITGSGTNKVGYVLLNYFPVSSIEGTDDEIDVIKNAGSYKIGISPQYNFDTRNILPPCACATVQELDAVYISPDPNSGIGAYLEANAFGNISETISTDMAKVSIGDRILVKDQTNDMENGIYDVVVLGSLTEKYKLVRSSDFDVLYTKVKPQGGSIVFSINGINSPLHGWILNPIPTTPIHHTIGRVHIIFSTLGNQFTVIETPEQTIVTKSETGHYYMVGLADDLKIYGNKGVTIPNGTLAQRPVASALNSGMIRLRTDA